MQRLRLKYSSNKKQKPQTAIWNVYVTIILKGLSKTQYDNFARHETVKNYLQIDEHIIVYYCYSTIFYYGNIHFPKNPTESFKSIYKNFTSLLIVI